MTLLFVIPAPKSALYSGRRNRGVKPLLNTLSFAYLFLDTAALMEHLSAHLLSLSYSPDPDPIESSASFSLSPFGLPSSFLYDVNLSNVGRSTLCIQTSIHSLVFDHPSVSFGVLSFSLPDKKQNMIGASPSYLL